MTSLKYDVVIIGGGIVGAACADEFGREGLGVAVVEPKMVGGGATAAGMGHLVVMDDSEAQFALTRYSQILWDEMKSDLPDEVEHETCGTIWVAADDEEMAEAERKEKYYSDRGVSVEILDAESLYQAEPNLRRGLAGGLRVSGDSVIYPPCAAEFLMNRAMSRGAQLYLGQAVEEVTHDGVRLRDGSPLSAGLVVNSAGSWAPLLTPDVELQKRKGHLVITDRYPRFVNHQLVELGYLKSAHSLVSDSVAFNIQPRRTGQLLIGSSRQYGVESAEVDAVILSRMLERAIEYMPKLRRLSALRTWTGFRTATPDNLPLIGPHIANERLYLATGHEGLGITTSVGTAKLLVDLIFGRRSAIPIDPYLPARVNKELVHA